LAARTKKNRLASREANLMKCVRTFFIGCILLLTGCAGSPPTPPLSATPAPAATATARSTPTPTAVPTPDQALIEQGIQVYKAAFCGSCHTLDVVGAHGIFAPTHNGMAATAAARIADPLYTGKATTAAEYLQESIRTPAVYLVSDYAATRHPMPAYTYLPAADVDALVYLLLTQ
jgi:hypothetical protein